MFEIFGINYRAAVVLGISPQVRIEPVQSEGGGGIKAQTNDVLYRVQNDGSQQQDFDLFTRFAGCQ